MASKNILITGGLGFIGSTLAIELVKQGHNITIVDSLIPEYGGNLFNIETIKDKVNINYCDITDKNAMEYVVRGKDVIYHLAGQVSHIMSMANPFPDIDYNVTGTAILLEACRRHNPTTTIIFTGTRGQYGSTTTLPVTEDAPTHPKGIYELTNLTAEKMFQIYYQNYGIKSILTRLTNIYGPRAQMKSNKYGVINWFVRQAIDNEEISLYGDGSLIRDALYVDDCVEAIMLLAQHSTSYGVIFNVGDDQPINFKEIVSTIVEEAKTGSYKFTPFSAERALQEPGDFYSDITRINKEIGWRPKHNFREGIIKTIEYYKHYKNFYW
jgi:UDP-glucose 4-epimerase